MNKAIKDFVENLYRGILLRDGETEGITGWIGLAENGLTSGEMVKNFITSAEAQSILSVLRLYKVFFGRAADIDGLRYWVSSLQSGLSLNDIAFNFTQSEEYKQKYLNASDSGVIEDFYNNLFERASDAGGKSHWLNLVERNGWTLGQVAAAFTVSNEATMPQGVATRFAETYLALRSSSASAPSTESVKALAGHSLQQAITESQTVKGTVLTGTLEQVHVYRAADEDKLKAAKMLPVETDASGRFLLTGGYGSFYAAGGRDVTTGFANNRWLSAVAEGGGSEIMITPLTSIIHALSRQGTGIADAILLTNKAFGIDPGVDLRSFHHLEKAIAPDSSSIEKKNALVIKGVIAQISILVEGAAALINATTENSGVDTRMVSLRVAEALAERIAGAAAQSKPFQAAALLSLDTVDVAAQLMAGSLRRLGMTDADSLKNAAANQLDGLTAAVAKIVTTFNTPISKTVQLTNNLPAPGSGHLIDAISLIAKTEGLAISELRTLLETGMQNGGLSNAANLLAGKNVGAAVRAFIIGKISNGVESTDASAIINQVFNAAPLVGNDDATPAPSPAFFVTNTLGKFTFSGSVTGNITLAIDTDGTMSFSRGGITAATKGSSLSNVTFELSAGQTFQLTNSQLAQLLSFTIKGSGNLVIQGALTVSTRNDIHLDGYTGTISYRIQDTPANILNSATAILSGAQEVVVVAGTNVFYSVAGATDLLSRLTDRTGLTLGVVDTATNLLANHLIAGVTAYKLSGNADNLTVANAAALVGISGFNADGKSITVQDTASAILGNHAITDVTAYRLGTDALDLSVANATMLTSISGFAINGKNLTVQDSAAAILASHAIAGVAAYKVLDTHTAILNQHAGMSYATAFLLSADATDMSVANAAALSAVNGFDVNGRVFTVKDSFNAIRANHAIPGVTKYQLDSNASIANLQLLQSEGLDLANLRYVIADLSSAVTAASTSLLNGADAMFVSASSGNDDIDLNRSGTVTVRVSIDLGAGDDIILGSESPDHINGNIGADTMDGGAGTDFYIYSDKGTDSLVNSGTAAAAGFDVVNIRGGDGFYIAPFTSLRTVLNLANPVTGSGTDLLAALNTAYSAVKVANNDVMFARFLDGSQYLVINDGQDSNTGINASDTVIKIVGSGLPAVAGFNLLIFNA